MTRVPNFPFLFLIVVELLSLSIFKDPEVNGISIFGREIRISQRADDITLLLKNKAQILKVLDIIDSFSNASGLRMNFAK